MGEKTRFCVLYWVSNGGQVDADGQPIFNRGRNTRGNCPDNDLDCRKCPLMKQELSHHGKLAIWVCPTCISEVVTRAKERNVQFRMPGYYAEGWCQYSGCSRPPLVSHGEEIQAARYSVLLQLFIGDIGQ